MIIAVMSPVPSAASVHRDASTTCDPNSQICPMTPAPWIAPQYVTYEGPASEADSFSFRWERGTRHQSEQATLVNSDAERATWRVKLPPTLHDGPLTLYAAGTQPPLESRSDGRIQRAAANPSLVISAHRPTIRAIVRYDARASVGTDLRVRLRGRYIADRWQTVKTWRLVRSHSGTGRQRVQLGLDARSILRRCSQFSACELQATTRLTALHSTLADLTARRSLPTPRERPNSHLDFLPGRTSVAGHGRLYRYGLFVEGGLRVDRREFAQQVFQTLADRRSWRRGGRVAFQQIADRRHANTRILLVSPRLVDRLCYPLRTRGYVSCTRGSTVILNVNRWRYAVRYWPLSRLDYRRMLINHEVGHRLGQHHRHCPGRGQFAPVMQQQTYGLHGCRANPWPLSYELRSAKRADGHGRRGASRASWAE
jgi:hypothetical protein